MAVSIDPSGDTIVVTISGAGRNQRIALLDILTEAILTIQDEATLEYVIAMAHEQYKHIGKDV